MGSPSIRFVERTSSWLSLRSAPLFDLQENSSCLVKTYLGVLALCYLFTLKPKGHANFPYFSMSPKEEGNLFPFSSSNPKKFNNPSSNHHPFLFVISNISLSYFCYYFFVLFLFSFSLSLPLFTNIRIISILQKRFFSAKEFASYFPISWGPVSSMTLYRFNGLYNEVWPCSFCFHSLYFSNYYDIHHHNQPDRSHLRYWTLPSTGYIKIHSWYILRIWSNFWY